MFTYAVHEKQTKKTHIIVARNEARAKEIAQKNFKMPVSGFYTVTLIA